MEHDLWIIDRVPQSTSRHDLSSVVHVLWSIAHDLLIIERVRQAAEHILSEGGIFEASFQNELSNDLFSIKRGLQKVKFLRRAFKMSSLMSCFQ